MIKRFFALAMAVITTAPLLAQSVRKYSNEYMSIGVGAQALGLSNSVVASTGDVTSGYWNPAGLTAVKSSLEMALMHSEYFAGIAKYDYASFAAPADSQSTLGFSFIRMGVDNIANTIELVNPDGSFDYNKIKSFSVADYGFLFSYARKMKVPNLSIGANAKVIYRMAGNFARAWGFGFDAGAQYSLKNWRFGVTGRDITGTFNSWSYSLDEKMKEVLTQTGNELPTNAMEITLPRLIIGASYKYTYHEKFGVRPEINVDMTFDGMRNTLINSGLTSLDPHTGVEFSYSDLVYLRAGVFNIQKVLNFDGNRVYTMQPNFGVGVHFKNISLDYALANIGSQAGIPYSNVFSLKLDFYKKKKYHFE